MNHFGQPLSRLVLKLNAKNTPDISNEMVISWVANLRCLCRCFPNRKRCRKDKKNHVCLKTFISVYFNIYVLYSRKVFTSKKLDVHYNTVYSQEIHWKIFDLCIKRAAFTLMSNGYEKTMGISWMSVDLITIMKFNNYDLPSAINLIAYVSPWTVAGNQKDLCS